MTVVYYLPEKEVHMVGDYVGVVWNTRDVTTKTVDPQGRRVTTTERVRTGTPYIDFLDIREDDGEPFENDDDPVSGGLTMKQAAKIAQELLLAVEYLKAQEG